MKKLVIILIALQLHISSCNNPKANDDLLLSIERIENSLLPPIVIEGTDIENYNIHERMRHYNVPGVSIAFLENGELTWAKGYGYTTFDSITPVDENTLFQAASISKPVATMAALSLVEDGKIDLDDNVNDFLADWKVAENDFTSTQKVTLRRLLTHSAGLTVHGFGGYASDEDVPTLIQVLNGAKPANSDPVVVDIVPGTEYRYSGGGFTVMQKLVIDLTGKSFPSFMNERILSKIGMANSSYEQPLPERLASQAAPGHDASGKMIDGRWHTYPEMAAAGLWTTPSDLLAYALEVQQSLAGKSNRILSQEMTEEMLTRQIGSQGLGLAVRGTGDSTTFSHGGSNEGYRCQLLAFAGGGQGVAIMTNGDNGGPLMAEILRSISAEYEWWMAKSVIKTLYPVNEESLQKFAGQYKFDEADMVASITVKENHLVGVQLWDNLTFDMYPESELLFFNKEDGARFEFKVNDEGNITEILIQNSYRFVKME